MSDVEQIETQEPSEQEQPTQSSSDRPRSGYARLRNRHRDLIELYENLMKDHTALTAKHEELQADVQRLLAQHARLMQAVRSGPQRAVGAYP
jgi:molybdenum-dependent DNA-binding transcriptional regulator ModE